MAEKVYKSMSFANPHPPFTDGVQKLAAAIGGVGLLLLGLALLNIKQVQNATMLWVSLSLLASGTIIFSARAYLTKSAGIKNDGVWFNNLTNRGLWAWVLGIIITGFYVLLYWFPSLLGLNSDGNTGLVHFFDPLSMALKGEVASQWFVYGTLYTLAILIFGIKFIWKYRHNKYQIVRTISVMFFQLGFAFLIPELLIRLNYPYNDFKNMWPLNYYFFDEWSIKGFLSSGNFGLLMLLFGIAMIFIISPILTYYFGKRWYCSWVCGCGGLAETAGDPFRHLSDKSLKAWQIERWMIHLVLLFAVVMTTGVIFSFLHNNPNGYWMNKGLFVALIAGLCLGTVALFRFIPVFKNGVSKRVNNIISVLGIIIPGIVYINYATGSGNAVFLNFYDLRKTYGFLIGAAFSGVIGVGFYPLMGSRVWCRFGCPMAAILGLQQKFFSRFRITTNGGQCISCGNCSTYCEMGIDVRSYAQKGQNIVRASCVGCGICAAVCPRGVLRLENGSKDIFEKTDDLRTQHIQ
ncbi:MAG: 4Fe-4S binding protein [Saprospiraceae bacterium]|nr:4Fe-4S binding protein [Saprospiraceae bacterium]